MDRVNAIESTRELINVCEVVEFTPQFIYMQSSGVNCYKSRFAKTEEGNTVGKTNFCRIFMTKYFLNFLQCTGSNYEWVKYLYFILEQYDSGIFCSITSEIWNTIHKRAGY